MKKILFLLLTVGLFTFTSCSKDDDGPSTSGTINGLWKLESFSMSGNIDYEGFTGTTEIRTLSVSEDNTVIFHDNNTYTSNSGTIEIETKMTFPGLPPITDTQTIDNDLFEDGTWERQGNKLTLTSSQTNEVSVWNIDELTNSRLVLSGDEETIPDEGNEGFTDLEVKIIFKR